jgi:hypothetical protein
VKSQPSPTGEPKSAGWGFESCVAHQLRVIVRNTSPPSTRIAHPERAEGLLCPMAWAHGPSSDARHKCPIPGPPPPGIHAQHVRHPRHRDSVTVSRCRGCRTCREYRAKPHFAYFASSAKNAAATSSANSVLTCCLACGKLPLAPLSVYWPSRSGRYLAERRPRNAKH